MRVIRQTATSPTFHSSLCSEAEENKEPGRSVAEGQRSSSDAEPRHHPLKTLAQPGDVGGEVQGVVMCSLFLIMDYITGRVSEVPLTPLL